MNNNNEKKFFRLIFKKSKNIKHKNNSYFINFRQKLVIILLLIFHEFKYKEKNLLNFHLYLNKTYKKIQLDLNLTFNKILKNKIKLSIYYQSIKNGGIERLTALLLNYLDKVEIFETYLLTNQPKEENEYSIPLNTKRIIINTKKKKNLS